MLLVATTGNENFATGTTKVDLMFQPSERFGGAKVPLWSLAKNQNPAIKVETIQQPRFVAAAPGYRPEMGKWVTSTLELPDGLVLDLRVVRTSHGYQGMRAANALLRMREGAAFRRVSALCVGWAKAAFQKVSVEGKFDILSIEEAEEIGVFVPPGLAQNYGPARQRLCMEFSEIAGELERAAKTQRTLIENTEGEEVAVKDSYKPRALDI